jgi:hypothetical protein
MIADILCSSGFPLIQCPSVVGWITVAMAFVIFVGSVYLILAAVFGVRMGYLVLAVAFFGWMMIFSALWAFGFWSGGLGTQTNLGPRGTEPHWQPIVAGIKVASEGFPVASKYPNSPWHVPAGTATTSHVSTGTFTAAVQEYLANQVNAQLAKGGKPATVESTDFTVSNIEFTTQGKTSLAAGRAYFNGGGPALTVIAYHDSGDVPVYSFAFLGVSVIAFLLHLPFLDRAERKRKAVLTGGRAPEWRGPA